MRDLIIALIILCAMVWAFSFAPCEDKPGTGEGIHLPIMGEKSATEGEPAPDPRQPPDLLPAPTSSSAPPAPAPKEEPPGKTVDELALEVIVGLWGYMEERWQSLTAAGYDAKAVQERVNEILGGYHDN